MHPNMETMEGVGFEKDGAVEDNACTEEQCSFYCQEQCSFNIIYIHYPISAFNSEGGDWGSTANPASHHDTGGIGSGNNVNCAPNTKCHQRSNRNAI